MARTIPKNNAAINVDLNEDVLCKKYEKKL